MLVKGKMGNIIPSPELIKEKIEKILTEINKPSRYVGKEPGSINKDWNECSIKTAIAFPDMYEVGISNLGHRILYHLVNKEKDFLADRVYAPSLELKEKMSENQIPVYGVETFRSLAAFDVVAFSLQYELSYPTILSMLDMSNIPVRSADREGFHPIIIAGGPGSYNPESLTEFIDIFLVGDGEDSLNEFLKELEKLKSLNISRDEILKSLLKIEGLYIPKFYRVEENSVSGSFNKPKPLIKEAPERINKRISELKIENHPVSFPVPFSPCVHDRAVVELRRGCGRMCRFCQPCFVNLPVRERAAEDVKSLVSQLLKNTGYEEYSLLSLSSNDYKNIENLVCDLNKEHSPKGASISLPSQRADAFSLELAKQVQSVRKSTLTFAPEAGSQRLRDVINKNLSQEQILNAIIPTYQSGWSHLKLYFMIGLPTETFEDLDAIITLLGHIKSKAYVAKKEFGLKDHLDLTCTISIFVPKPFTPFQWCAQDSVEVINEKARYLREKARFLKGIKLKFHDSFPSQLEAVFTRGDRKLNELVFKAWENGSYLDAWSEHFNKEVWHKSASEAGIDFHSYASNQIDLEAEKPWDIINTGIDADWLKSEYKKALVDSTTIPCDDGCASCGVCSSFSVKPDLKSELFQQNQNETATASFYDRETIRETYKYRLEISKKGVLKYISHLDWQGLVYKSIRKAELNIAFSHGFNPSPKISLGSALPLFIESASEYIDLELYDDMIELELKTKLNDFLPEESKISKIVKISKEVKSIDIIVGWAKYTAVPVDKSEIMQIDLACIVKELLLREDIFIEKISKKGLKKSVDIRPSINSLEISENELGLELEFTLSAGQGNSLDHNIKPLRADDFMKILTPDINWRIKRTSLLDINLKELL